MEQQGKYYNFEYSKVLENLQFEFTSTPLSTSDSETGEIRLNFDGVNELGMVA